MQQEQQGIAVVTRERWRFVSVRQVVSTASRSVPRLTKSTTLDDLKLTLNGHYSFFLHYTV